MDLKREYFLATTSQEDLWPKNKDIVLLGEWCKKHTANQQSNSDCQQIKFPWNDFERLDKSIKYCQKTYENVLKVLSIYLNEVHGIEKDKAYWRKIVGYFLTIYIQTLFDKYTCLKDAKDRFESISTISIDQSSYFTCNDALSFYEKVRVCDNLNLQLYGQISEFLGFPIERRINFFDQYQNEITSNGTNKISKTKLSRFLENILDNGKESEVALYVTLIGKKDLFKLSLLTGFKAWPIYSFPQKKYDYSNNQDMREGLNNLPTNDEFERLVLSTLRVNLPYEFLEGFSFIRDGIKPCLISNVPKKIITGVGFLWDTAFSIWAAECAQKGTKIYGVQHGGTYGESEPSYGEIFERSVVDKFISWGWSDDEDVIPLPAQGLFGLKKVKQSKKRNKEVLWVTTLDSRYANFLSHLPFSSRFLEHFNWQVAFWENLDGKVRNSIKIRLYPRDFGWGVKEMLQKKCSGLKFQDNNDSFRDSASQAMMVVLDHFGGTTFLECLSMNVPTIIFGNPDLFKIRDAAKPFYEELERVGVLHYSPESVATKLNEIYSKVDDWWGDQIRQTAVQKFKKNFALTSNTPIQDWARFLRQKLNPS
ncbi:putative transferase (TIGR04331 family) [Geothermobacter ehrlichii]|uniref:Putative transferase (TIGR04331 family) n=1 Tax=Geothermobacter ehrlichii TaxID=213224 RepID=A0A5D3WHN5_9BACT|nr:LIC12162 family protein [Geothermobacter ehrlichii]TYO98359.1 putative transferase (TIGR04331 family) [Geothermobacter ehrlichii]